MRVPIAMVTSDAPTADVTTGLHMFLEKALETDPEADPEQESAQVRGPGL